MLKVTRFSGLFISKKLSIPTSGGLERLIVIIISPKTNLRDKNNHSKKKNIQYRCTAQT